VEARDVAFAAAQRGERVEAAFVLQLDGAGRGAQLAQPRDGEIVAGVDDEVGRLGERLVQRARELRGEVVELRGEARLRALAGPQEAFAEQGEARAAALELFHQGGAEELLPFRDHVPRVTIGGPGALRRLRELAGRVDALKDRDQAEVELALACRAEAPDRAYVDADHAPIIAVTG